MRISPVYNPKTIVNTPPQLTNHPLLEHLQFHNQEFKANEKEMFLDEFFEVYNNTPVPQSVIHCFKQKCPPESHEMSIFLPIDNIL